MVARLKLQKTSYTSSIQENQSKSIISLPLPNAAKASLLGLTTGWVKSMDSTTNPFELSHLFPGRLKSKLLIISNSRSSGGTKVSVNWIVSAPNFGESTRIDLFGIPISGSIPNSHPVESGRKKPKRKHSSLRQDSRFRSKKALVFSARGSRLTQLLLLRLPETH